MASSVKDILAEILNKKKQVKGDKRKIEGYNEHAVAPDSKGFKDIKASAKISFDNFHAIYKRCVKALENKEQLVTDKIEDNDKKHTVKITTIQAESASKIHKLTIELQARVQKITDEMNAKMAFIIKNTAEEVKELTAQNEIKNAKLQKEILVLQNEENSRGVVHAQNEMLRFQAIMKSEEVPVIPKTIGQRQAEFRVEENETDIKYLEKVMNEMDADEIELHTAKKVFEEMVAHRKAIEIHNRKVMEKQAYEIALEIDKRGYYESEEAKDMYDNAYSRNG